MYKLSLILLFKVVLVVRYYEQAPRTVDTNAEIECMIFVPHEYIHPYRQYNLLGRIQYYNKNIAIQSFEVGNRNTDWNEKQINTARQECVTNQKLSSDVKVHYMGHSQGQHILQNYLIKPSNSNKAKSLILLGGYVGREFYKFSIKKNQTLIKLQIRTLTIIGELDNSLVRSAESFYHLLTKASPNGGEDRILNTSNFQMQPMIVISGANNASFTDDSLDEYDQTYKSNELRNEINFEVVHTKAGTIIERFLTTDNGLDYMIQNSYLEYQKQLLNGMQMENNQFLKYECYFGEEKVINQSILKKQEINDSEYCKINSRITFDSQIYIINPSDTDMDNIEIKTYLINENNNSIPSIYYENHYKIELFQENIYKSLDQYEDYDPYISNSAKEIQSQLITNEIFQKQTNIKTINLADKNICSIINEKIYDTTLKQLPKRTIDRQYNAGVLLRFAKDIDVTEEGIEKFKKSQLHFKFQKQFDQNQFTGFVQSQSFHTDLNNEFPGLYQCKLLSPFKVIEWVQKDSLKFDQLLQEE